MTNTTLTASLFWEQKAKHIVAAQEMLAGRFLSYRRGQSPLKPPRASQGHGWWLGWGDPVLMERTQGFGQ